MGNIFMNHRDAKIAGSIPALVLRQGNGLVGINDREFAVLNLESGGAASFEKCRIEHAGID